jgi:predicted nucleotidyltransferase
MKHNEIVNNLVRKYKSDKNVLGIYLFGSMATGKAKPTSDIDVEIIFKKRKKSYELINKRINEIRVDLSCYSLKKFEEDFTEKKYLTYLALTYKILYDPKRILKKHLKAIEKYFSDNPDILKFWKDKERKYKQDKKLGRKKEDFFDICKELEMMR